MSESQTDTFAEPGGPRLLPVEQADQLRRAAEQLREILREQLHIELNYDLESVRWLDKYIERTRLRTDISNWKGSINLIGSFLGECVIRNFGGQWAMHDEMVCVSLDEGNVVFPYNIVTKQFENGADAGDSISSFYEITEILRALEKPLTPAQNRLLEFSRKSDHRIFIFSDTDETTKWKEVDSVSGGWVKLKSEPSVS
ncbi:MAG: hypothetical protein LBQ62_03195, partial [Candidatus Accumulibacter sp.]|nr:hypothetical protein [Accumulibacter sp.]